DYRGHSGMVVFANPNAPTGMAMTLSGIRRILDQNPDCPVVVDEAYIAFGGETAVKLMGEYENLIIVRTFSKSRCMAGARLGYAIASKGVIADLEKIKFSINPYDVNTFTQTMGAAAMRDGAYYDECCEKVKSARDYTAKALTGMGFRVLPSQANFVFASPPDGDGLGWYRRLREKGILVRHFDKDRLREFNRVTIGTMEQMREFILASEEMYG
ncbi:MAG: histidinol-phosphate transaminase, partial [Clostridia bacterium]|nr:histidinol-phosphate transaminase [Clostridia bacterium]